MRLTGFESQAQRLAGAEQVLLADHIVRRLRAQLFGEGGAGVWAVFGKQIAHGIQFLKIVRPRPARQRRILENSPDGASRNGF